MREERRREERWKRGREGKDEGRRRERDERGGGKEEREYTNSVRRIVGMMARRRWLEEKES